MNETMFLNEQAVTVAAYYRTYASHLGMWQLRDHLSDILCDIAQGEDAPAKTDDAVFALGPDDGDFEIVPVGIDEYLVRKECLYKSSTGPCCGINKHVLNKLVNNDFAYLISFWDRNTTDTVHHITEDGLYRGKK